MEKECGNGWDKIVDPLIELCEDAGVEIHQIKEKFGGLRFYTGTSTKEIDEAIREAEIACEKTCESCGDPGELRQGSWLKTLCDSCEGSRRA